ncbi:CDP-alcohol phosphatidyltransferase family protein [Gorillibacterium timonense]|uniref:CDP-alcohol phosphatidyltransferase family protein n=1 Tax=Gorillibacterium timonense TaxID=1689269 RepID=UPI00071DE4F7|nr:CDP-alcohol phosphatidyltransferase family protein [Gorillibacterium timonense]
MKHVPNLLSVSRIVLLIGLPFTLHIPWAFTLIYLICGISDGLDGYVARKTGTASDWGARLDSMADLLFFTVIAVSAFIWLGAEIQPYLPWILVAALIRCMNLIIAAWKYHTFASVHTWGNKAAGLLVFIAPLFLGYQLTTGLWLVCLAAVLSAVEECLIHLTSPKLDLNRRSLFF